MRLVGRLAVVAVCLALGLAGGSAVGFLVPGGPDRAFPRGRVDEPAPPRIRPLTPDTLLAWSPGGLPAGFARRVGRLAGVDRAVAVVSGTVWLNRSMSSDGGTVDRPPKELGIPLEVAAADLSSYSGFLPPAYRSILPSLQAGEAALGATSRSLRRLSSGGILVVGPRRLTVAGVLPDTAIGAHELFVSRRTAATLGLNRERYLLIDPAHRASRRKLIGAIRRLLPPGVLLQTRGPGETPYFRHGDAVLPQVRLKELFGEFAARPTAGGYLLMDPTWAARNIDARRVPVLGRIRGCHRALVPQLTGALREVLREGLAHLIDPSRFGGCYSPRFLNRNPEAGISHHSWGVAADINVSTNRFGRTPHQDPRVVAIFERWGFTWGGDWLLPDGMHFEFMRFPVGV